MSLLIEAGATLWHDMCGIKDNLYTFWHLLAFAGVDLTETSDRRLCIAYCLCRRLNYKSHCLTGHTIMASSELEKMVRSEPIEELYQIGPELGRSV